MATGCCAEHWLSAKTFPVTELGLSQESIRTEYVWENVALWGSITQSSSLVLNWVSVWLTAPTTAQAAFPVKVSTPQKHVLPVTPTTNKANKRTAFMIGITAK